MTLPDDRVMVGYVKKIRETDIAAGVFSHLGVHLESGRLVVPEGIVPRPDTGRYSKRNVYGLELVRKDLPMTTRTFYIETPNWGDWSNGSHTVEWDREVYEREFIPPKELAIRMTLIGQEDCGERLHVIRFLADEVLDRRSPSFGDDLLYDLNLLQENVGGATVFAAAATIPDFLDTVYVHWEILPVGDAEDTVARVLSGVRAPTPQMRTTLAERYRLLLSLRPDAFISGTSGFSRYFGAKFGEDLVVFENLEYGNAIYVMFEDWQALSQMTRLELLTGKDGFVRIIHREGWERRLGEVVAEYRRRSR